MTCPACARCELAPTAHDFAPGCVSCKARALVATGFELTDEPAALRVLDRLFGAADEKAGKRHVLAWSKKRAQAIAARTITTPASAAPATAGTTKGSS